MGSDADDLNTDLKFGSCPPLANYILANTDWTINYPPLGGLWIRDTKRGT